MNSSITKNRVYLSDPCKTLKDLQREQNTVNAYQVEFWRCFFVYVERHNDPLDFTTIHRVSKVGVLLQGIRWREWKRKKCLEEENEKKGKLMLARRGELNQKTNT